MDDIKKVVVTGGSGFLGSHIADRLSDAGHEVVILDNRASSYLRNDQQFIEVDMLDAEAVDEALEGADVVYHFAAFADLSKARDNPSECIRTNVEGTINILESCRKNMIKRLVFSSSIYVYSRTGSFYRVSKHACELMIEEYHERFGLEYTVLRFGTLYGTRADMANSVYNYLKQAHDNKRIEVSGTGEEVREFIHVYDAAEISLRILDEQFIGQTLILTGHHRMRTQELIEMINEMMHSDLEISYSSARKAHYRYTPYSYLPRVGRKIVMDIYQDLGQGILEMLEEIDADSQQNQAIQVRIEN